MSMTQIAILAAAAVSLVGYVAFILRPAWESYGRIWERMAASFLTLYMLATLIAIGGLIGLAIFYGYLRLA